MTEKNVKKTDIEFENEKVFPKRRIVDLLDIQVLLAIIVLFVSAWAYLYGVICGFTSTEPHEERMSYILVHYILTLVLLLCIIITYLKGRYLLNTTIFEFGPQERKHIDLFIDGWGYALLICVLILTIDGIHWALYAIFSLAVLIVYMVVKRFHIIEILALNTLIIICFPAFISLMTNLTKNFEIITSMDKETSIVTITVNPKSYDGQYFLNGLTDTELILDKQYTQESHVIKVHRAFIHNNEIVLGLTSPAGKGNFWSYGIAKVLNKEKFILEPTNASVYKKTVIITSDNN